VIPAPASATAQCSGTPFVSQMLFDAQGRVLVLGHRNQCLFAMRLREDGSADPGFGEGGSVDVPQPLNPQLGSARLQPDGTIEIVAIAQVPAASSRRVLSFRLGIDGQLPGSLTSSQAFAYDEVLAPQADGSVVAARGDWIGNARLWRIRIVERDGSLRATFQVDGFDRGIDFTRFFVLPGGGLAAVGERFVDHFSSRPLGACAWRANGQLDPRIPASCLLFDGFSPLHARLAPDGSLYLPSNPGPDAAPSLARLTLSAPVVEFHNTLVDHYFIALDGDEAAGIDAGAAGPGWQRTGATFAAGGTTPVCRFYGTPGVGPSSHFYTASADECERVKGMHGWSYEGLGFHATAPAGAGCPAGTLPVHRLYNNRWRENDSNHRYVTDLSAAAAMVARGWTLEGVAFCARR
jgi:hypothetical protein